jgi:hypothetical protein
MAKIKLAGFKEYLEWDEKDRRVSAHHEAGHLIASFLLKDVTKYCGVMLDGLDVQGGEEPYRMMCVPQARKRPFPLPYKSPDRNLLCAINHATDYYAGPAAESRFLGRKSLGTSGAFKNDFAFADEILAGAVDLQTFPADRDVLYFVTLRRWIKARAWNLTGFYWNEIQAIAEAIFERSGGIEPFLPIEEIKGVFHEALLKRAKAAPRGDSQIPRSRRPRSPTSNARRARRCHKPSGPWGRCSRRRRTKEQRERALRVVISAVTLCYHREMTSLP